MINKIENCRNRNISESFNGIKDIVNYVKNPPITNKEWIDKARKLDRISEEYRDIKISRLPAICIHFNFSSNYIAGKNISTPTGYLYLDVDNLTEEEIYINKTYVCAYWRSLSNKGITLVVKVEGLTSSNLKEATKEIATLLDIPYDDRAVSIDRVTVLSYDPNAYYNDNTEVIPVNEIISDNTCENLEEENLKSTHHNTIINTNSIGYDCNGLKMRFNNLDEKLGSREIIFDESGFCDLGAESKVEYAQVFYPFKKVGVGKRENIFKSIAFQLISLNKNVPKENIKNLLIYINKKVFVPILTKKEVEETIEKIYKNIDTISPKANASRRFIYDETRNISSTDKRKLNCKQISKDRSLKCKNELLNVLENWDKKKQGKLTIENITAVSGKNKKTVQKYHKELKSQIIMQKIGVLAVRLATYNDDIKDKSDFSYLLKSNLLRLYLHAN